MAEFLEWGAVIESVPEELANRRLLGLLRACESHPHFEIVELRRIDTSPPHVVIVVEAADGTIAARNEAGVRPRERLALSFQQGAHLTADVRALRVDFPKVVHLNGVPNGQPASLCLYENWSHAERQWTPERHLERILWWLRETAAGTLHADDQPLEQLFYDTGYAVVLPAEFSGQAAESLGAVQLTEFSRGGRKHYLIASKAASKDSGAKIQLVVVDLPAVANPPIQSEPETLGELDAQLRSMRSELMPHLGDAFERQLRLASDSTVRDGKLLLLLRVPRVREGVEERVDVRGFFVDDGFDAVGVKLGVLFRTDAKQPAYPMSNILLAGAETTPAEEWKSVRVNVVAQHSMPSSADARRLSGIPDESGEFSGVLAGVGSLGSAMADIWGRGGWGSWTFIDPDQVAPHNLIRHRARAVHVGVPKADLARHHASTALGIDRAGSASIYASANNFENEAIVKALGGASLLVDATTTIEVPRDWSERELPRCASVFFTFSGSSAVLLLEDEGRAVRLAALEAQYYRAIISSSWGEAHLARPPRVRVGMGCRDHSVVLGYDLVQLHAAQLARRLRQAAAMPDSSIQVWTLDDATGAIAAEVVPTFAVRERRCGQWTVRWDAGLEAKMHALRSEALPAETGGILVGVIDQKLMTITVVDAGAAPADSDGDEQSFVRGTEGGRAFVEKCARLTGGMVGYVGEWHSHPKDRDASPSSTDLVLLATLTMRLEADGIPALMVIVSEGEVGVSLGTTKPCTAT